MKEFQAVFQMSKTILFEVNYFTLGMNKAPYFTTCAEQFTRNKLDYRRCGQAQKELLKKHQCAMNFFNKWDAFHLKNLNQTQYDEMQADMEKLKAQYNFIYEELDERKRHYSPYFGFDSLAEWSKQEPKKNRR